MFEKILGNEKIKEELIKVVKENKISHSYMFLGIEGIGKKMIAKEFAQMILCNDEKDKYCNKCKSCIEFISNNNPDYMYIEPDGNSIKIEQIRYFQKLFQEKPVTSNKKVCIINDADKMTVEAQNCLLKTLEEPPEYGVIILIGANENAFLNTIKSRCIKMYFRELEEEIIRKYLKKQFGMTDISTNMLETFQGSIGKAINLKDNKEEYEQIDNIIENLDKKDIIDIINMSNIIYKNKEDILKILEYINVVLLNLAKKQYKFVNCIEIVEDTRKRLKQNANYDMSIDNMIFNMWRELN